MSLPLKQCIIRLLCIVLISGIVSHPTQANAANPTSPTAFLSNYVQTLYDEESNIPVSQVKSVLQTSDGYLWFAGYQGLMRYNGINAKLFTPDDNFPTYNVNILFEDSSKQLWIGTNDSGLVLYRDHKFTVYGLDAGLPAASVRDIAEDAAGNVYAATVGGIAMISAETGEIKVHPQMQNMFVTRIQHIEDERFMCLTNDNELIVFDGTGVLNIYESDYFGPDAPISLLMSDGVLYVGTTGNTILVTDLTLSALRTITLPSRQTVNSFFKDSEGRLWVCADNGIGYLDGDDFTLVEGLVMNNSIERVYEDYEGNIWIASSRQGLVQLVRSKFTNLSFAAQLPDYTVNATAYYNGDLYIGADEGLVILRNDLSVENELTAMLNGIRIRSMLVDSRNRLLICTYEQYGVIIVKPDGETVIINEDSGLASNKTRCVMESADGSIVVGTSNGINIITGEAVVKAYTKADGLLNDMILSLCEDENGVIYAGSDGGGIFVIDDGIVANYTEKDGLTAGVILRMAIIEGGLWISTGNAICYMDETGILTLDKLMAYDESIFDILHIGDDIWFLQSNSVNICNIQSIFSDGELHITQLQRRDGLSSPITANSWNELTDEGMLYISTGKSVLRVDTTGVLGGGVKPYVAVSEVLADGVPLDLSGGLKLPSDTLRVDIYISLMSYSSKDGDLSYMLEGFDSDIKTVPRNEVSLVSYTNLRQGNYVFRLYGTNAKGIRSDEIALSIDKAPSVFEMASTRMLLTVMAVVALILGVWLFVSLRTKTITKQRQEYKDITAQAISVIAVMTDSKNAYATGHSRRVAKYSEMIGMRLNLSADELEALVYAALMHDIGKISIPDSILNKKSPLTSEEREIIKTHVTIGGDMLESITTIEGITLGARYHHERVDGTGYAEGLFGDDIPLFARIIGAANALDAMTSDRPYRDALPLKKIKSEFVHNAGTQFDERIAAIIIEMIDEEVIPL